MAKEKSGFFMLFAKNLKKSMGPGQFEANSQCGYSHLSTFVEY